MYMNVHFVFRNSLFEEGGKYFDKETGVLEAPMTIRVADQVRGLSHIYALLTGQITFSVFDDCIEISYFNTKC